MDARDTRPVARRCGRAGPRRRKPDSARRGRATERRPRSRPASLVGWHAQVGTTLLPHHQGRAAHALHDCRLCRLSPLQGSKAGRRVRPAWRRSHSLLGPVEPNCLEGWSRRQTQEEGAQGSAAVPPRLRKMVFESVVVDVLNRFLGDYVVNVDTSQLTLGIWGGNKIAFVPNLFPSDPSLPEPDPAFLGPRARPPVAATCRRPRGVKLRKAAVPGRLPASCLYFGSSWVGSWVREEKAPFSEPST